jgi:hypothetical protein
VRGKTEVADLALLPRLDERLHRTTPCKHPLDLLDVRKGMQLVQIEVVGLESLERGIQFPLRTSRVPLGRLARKETALAKLFQSWAKTLLGIAISGRHIKIVDAARHCLCDVTRCLLGRLVLYNDATEANDRQSLVGAAVRAPGNRPVELLARLELLLG